MSAGTGHRHVKSTPNPLRYHGQQQECLHSHPTRASSSPLMLCGGPWRGRYHQVPRAVCSISTPRYYETHSKACTYGSVLCLWHKHPYNASLDCTPHHEDEISLPLNLLQGHRKPELVDKSPCVQLAPPLEPSPLEETMLGLPKLTNKLENAIPFARISNDRTSTGYRACSGVQPKEYTAWKM